MDVQRETNMFRIKQKMTEIRRTGQRPVINNYYLNCEKDEEIFAVFGNETVIFWDDDRGVTRVYFYSVCPQELIELFKLVPDGAVVDYLTRNKGEYTDMFQAAGLELRYEMMRMVARELSPEEREEMIERGRLFEQTLYKKENVRVATEADCEAVYRKLYEVFDRRESHLCTKKELLQYIRNRWVVVYYEGEKLMGLNIFTIKANQFYGYQFWNGTGPEGYYSLTRMTDQLAAEHLRENAEKMKNKTQKQVKMQQKPSFCWINSKNRKIRRLIEWQGNKFDGLYDFVYEK